MKKTTGGGSPQKAEPSKSAKIPKTKTVPLAEVVELCGGKEHTIELLKDGTLIAEGRPGSYGQRDQNDCDGDFCNISMVCWCDYQLSENLKSLGDCSESYYAEIRIERARIDELLNNARSPGGKGNNSGRPDKYDWDGMWPHVLLDIQDNGIPDSVKKWAKRVSALKAWGPEGPDEATVRRRWRNIFSEAISLRKAGEIPGPR